MNRRGLRRSLRAPLGGGARPWTPANLSASVLKAWIRGDAGVTLSGSEVTTWADQSGNGRDWAQGTAAKRPTTRTVNGLTAIDFDGTDDELDGPQLAQILSLTGYHVIGVVLPDTLSGVSATSYLNNVIVGDDQDFFWITGKTNGGARELHGGLFDSGVKVAIASGLALTAAHLIDVQFSGSLITTQVDAGTPVTTAATTIGGGSTRVLSLGHGTVTSLFFDGCICEMLVSNAPFSASTRLDIRAWLASRWGVTA